MRDNPDFWHEHDLIDRGYGPVAGVDEVGRGPLAGPVVAAAVILRAGNIPEGLNDSKQLCAAKRANLAARLRQVADIGIGTASVEEIDQINILHASHLAMCRAVAALPVRARYALIDGKLIPPGLGIPATAIIKGDAKSQSIAAASIVAKVYRDRLMVDLAQQHPGFGWGKNAGYPTLSHLKALQDLGVTPHHRRSFKPVHNILYQVEIVSD